MSLSRRGFLQALAAAAAAGYLPKLPPLPKPAKTYFFTGGLDDFITSSAFLPCRWCGAAPCGSLHHEHLVEAAHYWGKPGALWLRTSPAVPQGLMFVYADGPPPQRTPSWVKLDDVGYSRTPR